MVRPNYVEYQRDSNGAVVEHSITIPYNPLWIILYKSGYGAFVDDDDAEIKSHLFVLREEIAKKYGIEYQDISRIRLPILDYSSGDPLKMEVYIRVRKSA